MQHCPNCGRNSIEKYPNGDKKCLRCSYKNYGGQESIIIGANDGLIVRIPLEQKNFLNPKILQSFRK